MSFILMQCKDLLLQTTCLEFTGTNKSKAYNGKWKLISHASLELKVFVFAVS